MELNLNGGRASLRPYVVGPVGPAGPTGPSGGPAGPTGPAGPMGPIDSFNGEIRADLQFGRVPRLAEAPPTVTLTADLADLGTTVIPGGKATNAAGWYTTVAPNDTSKLRVMGARAVAGNQSTFPDGFGISFNNVSGQFGGFGVPTIETTITGRYVEFILKQFAGTVFRLMVNGEYLTTRAQALGGTPGGRASLLVDFGDAAMPRRVALETNCPVVYGINYATGSSAAVPAGPAPKRIIFAGDSYTGAAGSLTSIETWARTAGQLLGFRDIVNSGVGATGWLAPGSGLSTKLRSRITNDIVNMSPDVLVIAMGHNDTSYSNSAIQAEVNTTLTALRSALPSVPIAVVGPFFVGDSPGVYAAMQTAIFAGAVGVSNVTTVDVTTYPLLPTALASKYVQGDGVHPTVLGASFMAYPVAERLAAAGFYAR